MKRISVLILFITTTAFAQTVYEVVPGTKGNEIVLSVANESSTDDAVKLSVALSNYPHGIELCNGAVQIDKLMRGEEKDVLFTFDVKRIPGAAKDTLNFMITDQRGGKWIKEIILEYAVPKEFKLAQNYPNPFNPNTTIEFTIPQNGRYTISIYNVLGQLIETLGDGEYAPGYYKLNFDAGRLASGMYIYRLSGDKVNFIKKMLLLK
ncbi:MAG: hypothetical protein CVV24_10900 [Ignavibacteriae bacterium HGW-Ignavibacteriae-3]|nr:MAG: hypothetical protein CVV24_10900 [Ignavibacteriae bacterium HGW-Ignavibacteriae-3]